MKRLNEHHHLQPSFHLDRRRNFQRFVEGLSLLAQGWQYLHLEQSCRTWPVYHVSLCSCRHALPHLPVSETCWEKVIEVEYFRIVAKYAFQLVLLEAVGVLDGAAKQIPYSKPY